jgi:hypothetical protein
MTTADAPGFFGLSSFGLGGAGLTTGGGGLGGFFWSLLFFCADAATAMASTTAHVVNIFSNIFIASFSSFVLLTLGERGKVRPPDITQSQCQTLV